MRAVIALQDECGPPTVWFVSLYMTTLSLLNDSADVRVGDLTSTFTRLAADIRQYIPESLFLNTIYWKKDLNNNDGTLGFVFASQSEIPELTLTVL